ncbi:PAS domain S-box-containing protein [Desulfocicer vacuolatum DSM 3385]|uniref:HTH-type transcriptional regulatory protein TyrR n=1 Tax=Desulfocicer vacuolatum DSM 3385 TaxID=1121400 RepID=A0A1W2ENU3_9BACT|nr:sigma 54-interacting transcriptional regulator [Desulfocicer vacuolatum]SMD11377.1 PAS domain S-box-containing protein [Desulfocicer vacuolatum DSM 3385]
MTDTQPESIFDKEFRPNDNGGTSLENEERLHYALTASEEGIWDWNLANDTGYLSPRYYEMLGYQVDEFPGTGNNWANMIHPDDKTKALKAIVDVIRKRRKSYHSTYRLKASDGSYRWILSRGVVVRWDEQEIPLRLVGTHLDITEARQKDEALLRYKENLEREVEKQTKELKATNRQLETILNASSESIWVCDGTGKVLAINRAAEKLLHIKSCDVLGKNIRSLKKNNFFDRSATLEVIKTRKTVTIMQNIKKPRKQLMVTGTPVFNDIGDIEMIIINERDLTSLNKMRDELEQAQSTSSRYKEELTNLNLKELKEQNIIAESKEMQQVITTVMKLARRKVSPILIMGESGTGKGLLAKYIHSQAFDKNCPFVQLNCAALPETLLEAELFGYDKGAFTGARDKGKIGLFEMASGGTLFLDELGEMSLPVQAKLLKCLEEKEVMRLGGLKPVKIDCNVITATNMNLNRQVRQGKFRQDLFFRLNTFTITLPPLRRRPEDIFEMIIFFLKKYNAKYGVKRKISSRGIEQIQAYNFPGNVRELKNILKKAVVMGENDVLEDLVNQTTSPLPQSPTMEHNLLDRDAFDFKGKLLNCEKQLMLKALERYDTTRSLAGFLKLSQSSVVRKLKIHGLSHRLRRNAQR